MISTHVNTLADAAALPDLSEFDGLSIKDIAHNIIAWPDDSDEQLRAILAIRARAPGIGHNRPPLADQLEIELEGLANSAATMIGLAEKALIVDEESAAKVNDLLRQLTDKADEVETARKARNKPYGDAVKLINDTFGSLKSRIDAAREGADRRGGLRKMLTAWDDRKRAEADAKRQAAIDEQRKREQEAERARLAAEEARRREDHAGAVTADLQAAALEDKAERAAVRADAIRPEPIRSNLGTTSRQRVITFTIDDEDQAFAWGRSTAGIRENLLEDFRNRVSAYLRSRAVGVAAVERGITLPGITAKVELGSITSRR